jgi:hypothetical protein
MSALMYAGHTRKHSAVSKVDKSLFLKLYGQNIHCQQHKLSRFLVRYQQFASHAYCGAADSVSKMASHERAFCLPCFELSGSVITVQR